MLRTINTNLIHLKSNAVELIPLELSHAEALYEVGQHPDTWQWLPRGPFFSIEDTKNWILEALSKNNEIAFSILLKKQIKLLAAHAIWIFVQTIKHLRLVGLGSIPITGEQPLIQNVNFYYSNMLLKHYIIVVFNLEQTIEIADHKKPLNVLAQKKKGFFVLINYYRMVIDVTPYFIASSLKNGIK